MKSLEEIFADDVPYIPEKVSEKNMPFIVYVPEDQYIFPFREEKPGKLSYGEYRDVICMYPKRGDLDIPTSIKQRAFRRAYGAHAEYRRKHSVIRQMTLPISA